jgi:signal transduction histidine kinase
LHTHSSYAAIGRPIPFAAAITTGLLDWWLWALLYPAARFIASRYSIRSKPRALSIGVWLASSLTASLVQVIAFELASAFVRWQVYGRDFALGSLALGFRMQLPFGVAVWWGGLLALEVYGAVQQSHQQQLQEARVRERLAQARVHLLQVRLQPHFLFNTLNAIAALVHADPPAAERMLTQLGDLLRHVLDTADEPEIELRTEIEFLERYVEIQKLRLGSRLRVNLDPDPATLDACLPTLLLQPIVENAIVHGIASASGGTVELHSGCVDGRLWVEVTDRGPGLTGKQESSRSSGMGLADTRRRLRALYGDDHKLELASPRGEGTSVRVEIPWRIRPAAVV